MPPVRPAAGAAGAVGAFTIVLWGGTAIANKIAVAHMDPMTAGVLRSMLAGLIGTGIAVAARLPRPASRSQWAWLLVSGIASFAVWPMLLSLGLGRTTANHSALIMAMLPAFTGLIGAALERRFPHAGWWAGIAIAGAGTALLVSQRSDGALLAQGDAAGDLIILAGTVVCALGYVAGGRLSPVLGTWATTFWGLAAALTVLVPSFLLLAPRTDWGSVGPAGWGAIAYMTVLSSLVGYAAWFWALGHGGITRIAPFQLMQPVLTVAFAAWLLGEALTAPLILSAAAILTGTAVARHWAAPRGPAPRRLA
jgi:drug/metabolite transporter (DMT)-like permease